MLRVLDLMQTGARQSAVLRYGATTGLVALSILARLGLNPMLPGYTFILWFPVVFAVALLFGQRAGVLATSLFAAATACLWMAPRGSFRIDEPGDVVALVIFIALNLVLVWLASVMHAALARASTAEREKDLLLREVHHRIRNDLQSITALLHMAQSPSADRDRLIAAALARIDVISRVYVRLRHERASATLDAQEFIEALVADLNASATEIRPVAVHASAQSAALSAGCAVSVGIVVNELVTNALKYAFPDDRPGTITVSFERANGDYVLSVRDDGVGLTSPEPSGTGLGNKLMRQLAMQLRGTLEVREDGGVLAVLRFPAASAAH